MNPRYQLAKMTTVLLGALSIPWGTFTGYCFGEGRYSTGLVSLALQFLVALADGWIWLWVLEQIGDKYGKSGN